MESVIACNILNQLMLVALKVSSLHEDQIKRPVLSKLLIRCTFTYATKPSFTPLGRVERLSLGPKVHFKIHNSLENFLQGKPTKSISRV